MTRLLPRYPVFVPSKGRFQNCVTARHLLAEGTAFRLVVEPSEEAAYRAALPAAVLAVLPFENQGSVVPARNWIRDLAESEGYERHWQLDDNIRGCRRTLPSGKRVPCHWGVALRVCEDFTDRYENIGVSGLNYMMFAAPGTITKPFWHNCHVYSCSLIWHRMPYRWRGIYNEDTDLCLQVLAGGLCTVALNVFLADKMPTLQQRGGNTDVLYHGDGRLKMARSLERLWPHVVTTKRRFGRPQHIVRDSWRAFDTPLKRRADIDWELLPAVDEYGLKLTQVADEVHDPELRRLLQVQRPE